MQWGYFVVSSLSYLYIIFILLVPSRRAAIARNAKVGRLFTAISLYTIIIWTGYPIVWILGEGIQKITVNTEILLYTIVYVSSDQTNDSWMS